MLIFRVLALPSLLIASALCTASVEGHPFSALSMLSAGNPISPSALFQDDGPIKLSVDSDGIFRVPVASPEGNIDSFWKLDSEAFHKAPIEAGKAPVIKVGNVEAKTPLLISKADKTGVLGSHPFEITSSTKSLEMRLIGNGDMTLTYAKFVVNFDGGLPVDWSRQAPSSIRTFDLVRWDLSKIHERAAGKRVIGQILLVDGSQDGVIGVASAPSGPPTTTSATSRAQYTFSNLFLGPRLQAYEGYQALIRDGEQYAKFFGVKTVDSLTNFGMPKEDMYAVLVEVNKQVASSEFDHDPSTWKQLPARLTEAAMGTANKKANELGHQLSDPAHRADFDSFVKLQAIHEWVRSRYNYSDEIAFGRAPRVDFRTAMASAQPSGVCGDMSWAVVHLATLAGLGGVLKLEGSHRSLDGKSHTFGHSWNAAYLPSGSVVFADSVRSYFPIETDIRSRRGVTFSPFGFGLETWQAGFFLHYYHSQTVIAGQRKSNDIAPNILTPKSVQFGTVEGADYFTQQNWATWYKLRTPAHFAGAFSHYFFMFQRK